MREVNLVVNEDGGRGKDLRNVSEHVGYALVDASPIQTAVDPLTILNEGREVECFGSVVPAEIGELGVVTEAFTSGASFEGRCEGWTSWASQFHPLQVHPVHQGWW